MIDVQAAHPFMSRNVMEIGLDYTYTTVENDESLPHETPLQKFEKTFNVVLSLNLGIDLWVYELYQPTKVYYNVEDCLKVEDVIL